MHVVTDGNGSEYVACESCTSIFLGKTRAGFGHITNRIDNQICDLKYDEICDQRNHKFFMYYEIPAVGGGNQSFETREDAYREFDNLTQSYPDVYAELNYNGAGGEFNLRTYDND